MGIEVQCFERGASAIRVHMADQNITAEQHQSADVIGIGVEDGAVDPGMLNQPRVPRRAERMFRQAETLGVLFR